MDVSGIDIKQKSKTKQTAPPPRSLMEGRKAVDELQLKYVDSNKKDVNYLATILGKILRYPSADLAERHRRANRLGNFDIKTQEQITKDLQQTLPSFQDEQIVDKKNILQAIKSSGTIPKKKMKTCKCCGLLEQEEELDLKTDIEHVNHVGMSTSLYFMTLQNLSTLLMIMFVIFSIFALVTNFHSSQLYAETLQGQEIDEKINTFKGILAIGLGSKFYYHCDFTELTFAAQCWLGAITVIVWAFMFIYIKRVEKQFEYRIDFMTTTTTDFSLLISNIPIEFYDANLKQLFQETIKNYIDEIKMIIPEYQQNFSQIDEPIQVHSVNRVSIVNLQRYYSKNNDLGDEELKTYFKQLEKCDKQWIDMIEHRKKNEEFKLSFEEIEQKIKSYMKLKKDIRERYKSVSKQKNDESIMEMQKFDSFFAFVTFQHTFNKELIQRLHERQKSTKHRLPCYPKRRYLSLTTEEGKQIELAVNPAPEPQDIIWQNYNMTNFKRLLIKIVTFGVMLAALSASFILVFLISQFQAKITNQNQNKQSIVASILSAAISLVVFIINYVLTFIIHSSTKMERNITYTREQTSIGFKSILATLVNTILIPIVVDKIIKDNLYGVDGLAQVIFFQAITSALLTPTLKVFKPGYIIYRLKKEYYNRPENRLYFTQKQLNKLNEQLQFQIGAEYVEIVAMYLFACFYASLQPIVVLIIALGLILVAYAQRICLYRLRKRPTPGDSDINQSMYYFIFAGPLFYSIGSLCLTNIYGEFKQGIIPNIFALLVSFFIIWAPYDEITRILMRKSKQVRCSTFSKDRVFLTAQYALLNPETKQQAQKQYNEYFQQFLRNLKSKNKRELQQIQQKFQSLNMNGAGQQQQQDDEATSHDPYIEIHINNSSTDLMIKQYEELELYLKKKETDQKLKDVPYYVYAGDYNNLNIQVYEMNFDEVGHKDEKVEFDFEGYNPLYKNYDEEMYDTKNDQPESVVQIDQRYQQQKLKQLQKQRQESVRSSSRPYQQSPQQSLRSSEKEPIRQSNSSQKSWHRHRQTQFVNWRFRRVMGLM